MAKGRDIRGQYGRKLSDHPVMPNFFDLVPQDRQLLIDEIARCAEQDLVSPEESVARFGVENSTEQGAQRIKDWLAFQAEQQAEAHPQMGGGGGHPGEQASGGSASNQAGSDGS